MRVLTAGNRGIITRVTFMVITAIFLIVRATFPYRSLDVEGWVALRDLAFTLSHLIFLALIAWGFGATLFDWNPMISESRLRNVFTETALGLGITSYLILVLGLLRILDVSSLFVLQLILSGVSSTKIHPASKELSIWLRNQIERFREYAIPIKWIIAVTLLIGLLSFINALGPLWDYDGMMYHVLGPKMFLDFGGIFPQTDNWYVNSPFTIELLFTFGLPYGDEVLAKLIHFLYGCIFIGASWHLSRHFITNSKAWIATGILLTVPTLPVWASFAYIDLGWSAYEVLAVLAFIAWWDSKENSALFLSGVFAGFAAGSKYLGLYGVGFIFFLVIYVMLRNQRRVEIKPLVLYSTPVILLVAPWLIKNWVWLGNPVYPMFFGGKGWSETRLDLYTSYLQSFGVGRTLKDYLALPWNVYAHHEQFGAVMNRIDIPSVLFPLSIVAIFKSKAERLRALLIFALVRSIAWTLGSQQIRFLMPVYPIFSLGTVVVLAEGFNRMRRAWKDFPAMLVGGLLLITAFYQLRILNEVSPHKAFLGIETEASFLSRNVNDFAALSFADASIPDNNHILMIGDGRGYYCYPKCLADPDHFRWAGEITRLSSISAFVDLMNKFNATHVLISVEDLDFLLQHDPKQVYEGVLANINSLKEKGILQEVYSDDWAYVFQLSPTEERK